MTSTGNPLNRLGSESSPYLRQHASNPVDWYPWKPEAFEKARRENLPVFLSIGYSACHWCHVMAHESFESEEVARLLNENFVSIKVDREERPDVDEIYMTAVQLTTGRGGWPLSAFLLPDGRPFFVGTYFPPEDRHGRAGFKTLLLRLSEAFRERRSEIDATAGQLSDEIVRSSKLAESQAPIVLGPERGAALTQALKHSFDPVHGGFGGAPKFPPHMALEWLLDQGEAGDHEALRIATQTLDAMALGGIHDHLGGGFHRYATDEKWLVPHFEKMLSDNGQLLGLYSRAFSVTGRALYERTARGIADDLIQEMTGAEGAFYAATDADSEGEEGKYFVWSASEVEEVLGAADAAFFAKAYQVRPEGNFRDEATGRATGLNILHLESESSAEDELRLAPMRARLLTRRKQRIPPGLDDKRIAGWNALAISGLAVAARCLKEPRYIDAARNAARFLRTGMRDSEGRLLRSWKEGAGSTPGFLEDEAFFAHALLDLAEAEPGEPGEQAFRRAHEVIDRLRRRFRRRGEAGFTFSGEGHEELLSRGRDLFDKAIPSGSASATRALLRLAQKIGDRGLASEARAALEEVSWLLARSPHGTESWHLALSSLFGFERKFGAVAGLEVLGVARPGSDGSAPVVSVESDPVRIQAFVASRGTPPGDAWEISLRIRIKEGFHLQGEDGLTVEAWTGKGLLLDAIRLPEPNRVKGEAGEELRFEGEIEATLSLQVARPPIPGEWLVAVAIRFEACGDGLCRPERALSLSIPIVVGGR